MAHHPLPITDVAVRDLRLDLHNYRIAGTPPSEQAVMAHLYDEHNVYELAEHILRDGYVDLELPLVVEENGHCVVLEGNRRVTALRTLLEPALVPSYQPRIEKLLTRFEIEARDLPKEIRVTVIETREKAVSLLARLHIGQPKKPWGPDEQARFLMAQIKTGATLTDIRKSFPAIKTPDKMLRRHQVREILKETPFVNPTVAEYAAGKQLKITSFEYAYDRGEIQQAIGLAFDSESRVTSRPATKTEVRALERLVEMFMNKELDTRSFPKRKDPKAGAWLSDLVGRLRADQPQRPGPSDRKNKPPTGRQDTISPEPEEESVSASPLRQKKDPSPTPKKGARRPNNPASLKKLPISVDYSETPPGLRIRFRELAGINIVEFPTGAAMLMRSVIESTIKHHYLELGRHEVADTLGAVARTLEGDYGGPPRESQLHHQIALLKNGRNPPGSIGWFNLIAHQPHATAKTHEVRDAWQGLEPLFTFLLAYSRSKKGSS